MQRCCLEFAINIIWISCSRIYYLPSVKPARAILVGLWNTFMCMIVLMCVQECKRIWYECESACGLRVHACLRQQFRAAQSMLGSLSLQIRQGEITQVHRGENPPSPTFSVCLPFSITPSISSSLSHAYLYHTTSTVLFTVLWKCNFAIESKEKWTQKKILQTLSFAGIPILYVCFLFLITVMCPLIGTYPSQYTHALACGEERRE